MAATSSWGGQEKLTFGLTLSIVVLLGHVVNAKHSAHSHTRAQQPISTEPISDFELVEVASPVLLKSFDSGLPLNSQTARQGTTHGCASGVEQALQVLCKGTYIPILQEDDNCCKKSCSLEELAKYCGRRHGSQRPEYGFPVQRDMAVTLQDDTVATDHNKQLEAEVPQVSKNPMARPFSLFQLLSLLFNSPSNSQKENEPERNLVTKPSHGCQRIQVCRDRLRETMQKECNMVFINPHTKRMGMGSPPKGQIGKRATSTGKTFVLRRVPRALVDDCCYNSCCVEDLRRKYCGSAVPIPEPVPALMKLFNVSEDERDLASPQPRIQDSLSSGEEDEDSVGEFESNEDSVYPGLSYENASGPEDDHNYDEEGQNGSPVIWEGIRKGTNAVTSSIPSGMVRFGKPYFH